MVRVIRAAREIEDLTNKQIVEILDNAGIDTTKARYELRAQRYERFASGAYYTKKFTCPGDYLAFFSMRIHDQPNAENINNELGPDYFLELIEEYPTLNDIEDHASRVWWGDGDDYIYYLKNLSTGELLYSSGEEEDSYEEDDWED